VRAGAELPVPNEYCGGDRVEFFVVEGDIVKGNGKGFIVVGFVEELTQLLEMVVLTLFQVMALTPYEGVPVSPEVGV
jgi:hypothetical protein